MTTPLLPDALRSPSWALLPSSFPSVDALFRSPAFDHHAWEARFVAAMREAFAHHVAQSPVYRRYAEDACFKAEDIRTLADVERMPWIFVQSFKEATLLSIPRDEVVVTLTSSGTQGTKTEQHLDAISQRRIEVAAYEVYRGLGIAPDGAEPCNYLMFMYDPAEAPSLGTSWTNALFTRMVPSAETVYLLRKGGNGEFTFDLELAIETYERFARSGRPLRILGFPAFIYRTLLEAETRRSPSISASGAGASWILTGGGWKNHLGQTIGKRDFARFAASAVGIPDANVRDVFGMSEHGVGYADCEAGNLHVPVYAHAVARDPRTLRVLPPGQVGLLHLYSPILRNAPSLSLLTTDAAFLDDSPCSCGRAGKRLTPVGRMGLKHYEGCAIRALEYLPQ
jgi:hypothetical protein